MSKHSIFYCFLLILISSNFSAQEVEIRKLKASRIVDEPKIDGLLNDSCWENAEIATDFIQLSPNPLAPASQKTDVKVVYTNEAIFISAMMYDSAPDSIMNQLTERDGFGNSDWFGVWFSCFNDGINAFEFFVTPQGVQMDAQVSTFGEDFNWNAVWASEARIVENGWVAEMKIPYSAIRFPDFEEQEWDVNFIRDTRKTREKTFWQTVDPNVNGSINQSGKLTGLKDIKAPPRLFFFPYFSGYMITAKSDEGRIFEDSYNGGLDLKYGINDAFTLDMTLIPDFGQVQSDNQVLNLSAFEVQFNENRQFFTEGTELFNKGNLFYSRRIGGFPINYYTAQEGEEVIDQPTQVGLVNATKVSGRNKNGLGIGLFNAVSKREYATVRDSLGMEREVETSPLTNYNVFVLDQNLRNNSYVTLINTNVLRDGETYDANVIGTEFTLRNKSNALELVGGAKYNKKFNYDEGEPDDGYSYGIGAGKVNGQFQFGGDFTVESKYYDPNDLGFLFSPNEQGMSFWTNYNIYEPFWNGKMNNMWSGFWGSYNQLREPNVFTGRNIGGEIGMNTSKFFTFGISGNLSPGYTYDYFEPRVDGEYFRMNTTHNYSGFISTDYSKKLALDVRVWRAVTDTDLEQWHSVNFRIAPRIQVGDKLQFNYVYSRQNEYNQQGFRTFDDNGNPIFTVRDRITHTNVVTSNYVFNNRMSVNLRLRHYWSHVSQKSFHYLDELGDLTESDFNGFDDDGKSIYDISFNTFNIDLVYRWVFAPGSELSIVWKNSIFDQSDEIAGNFSDNLNSLFTKDQTDSFSFKILYFIDYQVLKSKFKS